MSETTYIARRDQLERYFDRTAVEMWKRLTSDLPVSRVRATVRAGRDAMRGAILAWLPQDLHGARILDAGCGTGALAVELAKRGATVVGVDVSPALVAIARERTPTFPGHGSANFAVGDMLDPALGDFDHIVAMDSLIHYEARDIARMVATLAARAQHTIAFTIAPRTPMLSVMHAFGRCLPKGNRAPAIAPTTRRALETLFELRPELASWRIAREIRIDSGFYISQAIEVTRR